jgi:pantothenate kinase
VLLRHDVPMAQRTRRVDACAFVDPDAEALDERYLNRTAANSM